MNKFVTVLLSVFIIACCSVSLADGILPSADILFATPTPAPVKRDMIDLGSMQERMLKEVYQNTAGNTVLSYTDVTYEEYISFSAILGQAGYKASSFQETPDHSGVMVQFTDGEAQCILEYSFSAGTLKITLPLSMVVDQSKLAVPTPTPAPTPVPTPTPKPTRDPNDNTCSYCGGDGFCSKCGGLGDCEHCFGQGTVNCTYCSGLGKCHLCYGAGGRTLSNGKWKNCSGCSGLGDCRHCYGTGDKTCGYCNGLRTCSRCYGTGKCGYCHGTGHN